MTTNKETDAEIIEKTRKMYGGVERHILPIALADRLEAANKRIEEVTLAKLWKEAPKNEREMALEQARTCTFCLDDIPVGDRCYCMRDE